MKHLVHKLSTGISTGSPASFMAPNLYDTAWVSMLAKQVNGKMEWLFPAAFETIVENVVAPQAEYRYVTAADAVLGHHAALLTLMHHLIHRDYHWPQGSQLLDEPELRALVKEQAAVAERALDLYDPNDVEAVGAEVLIPAILNSVDVLGTQCRDTHNLSLATLEQTKFRQLIVAGKALFTRFRPDALYGVEDSTKVHSLEAFVGNIDFDKLQHRLDPSHGMMGSIASTAAYLMYASKWDLRAEQYLRRCFDLEKDFPNAYPTSTWEAAWIMSTSLQAGYEAREIGLSESTIIANFQREELSTRGGVIGFSPSIMEDADDTARTLLGLCLLRSDQDYVDSKGCVEDVDVSGLIYKFWHDDLGYFRTYAKERNASFSANCNAVVAILHSSHPGKYQVQIESSIKWLLDAWEAGDIKDKWVSRVVMSA